MRLRPERKDHVWSYNFVHDRTGDGQAIRLLVVIDGCTRECLAIDVARRMVSDDVLERLSWLMATRGAPAHIRSDNGMEMTARVVRNWLRRVGVKTLYIEPSSPWENGCVESLNGKLRDELLNREVFETLQEVRVLIARWREHYNAIRPHSSLGYRPPAPETIAAGPPSAPLRAGQQRPESVESLTYIRLGLPGKGQEHLPEPGQGSTPSRCRITRLAYRNWQRRSVRLHRLDG